MQYKNLSSCSKKPNHFKAYQHLNFAFFQLSYIDFDEKPDQSIIRKALYFFICHFFYDKELLQMINTHQNDLKLINLKKIDNQKEAIKVPEGFDAPLFQWDPIKTSKQLELIDQTFLTCKTIQGKKFRFTAGKRYYFEILLNKGCQIKIGVSRPDIPNLECAFSDTQDGWAIYKGQTRHGNNSTGSQYGTLMEVGDIIGVAVDMVQGTLGFYKNQNYWGVGFKQQALKQGELVAVVASLFYCDQFSIIKPQKE